MKTCALQVDTTGRSTEAVASFVAMLVREAGLPSSKAYWLRLAAEEITTNIAQHGYRGCGPLRLTSEVGPDRVCLRIEDEAPEFDPRSHDPGPQLQTAPSDREVGGFGLLLALHKLDGFCYERLSGQNCNTLIMFRSGTVGAYPPEAAPDDAEPGTVNGVTDGVNSRADHR